MRRGVLGGVLVLAAAAGTAGAQVRLTQAEALALAFSDSATVERRTAFLSPGQLQAAGAAAGPDAGVSQGVVTYYVGSVGGRRLGVAYFDAHRVRSLNEVLMIVVGPDGRLARIEVLAFHEPPEYAAPGGWLARLTGRGRADGLRVGRDVPSLTGATLTAEAVTRAARRVLALHEVIRP